MACTGHLSRGPAILSRGKCRREKTGSSEDIVYREPLSWESLWSDEVPTREDPHFLVALGSRLPVDEDPVGRQVDQPSLTDAHLRVEGHLDVPVIGEAGIRDLHEEEDILGPWGADLEVQAAAEHHGVRLGDRSERGQLQWVLGAQDALGPEIGQQVAEPHDTESVRVPDRRHLNDLSTDELQPGIRGERSVVPRVLEFLDRPELLLNGHRHEPPPTSILHSLREESLSQNGEGRLFVAPGRATRTGTDPHRRPRTITLPSLCVLVSPCSSVFPHLTIPCTLCMIMRVELH